MDIKEFCRQIKVPEYIINLVNICGFLEQETLKNMDDDKIAEMEVYIRRRFSNDVYLKKPELIEDIFGGTLITAADLLVFSFNPGARSWLLQKIPGEIRSVEKLVQYDSNV